MLITYLPRGFTAEITEQISHYLRANKMRKAALLWRLCFFSELTESCVLFYWMGSCHIPPRETHSGGQPWTPPTHWPTRAFWLIISSSLDSVLCPCVSQALYGLYFQCESIFVLLHWLSQLSQFFFKKRERKPSLKHLGFIVQWTEGWRLFLMMSPDQPRGHQANLPLLSVIVQS